MRGVVELARSTALLTADPRRTDDMRMPGRIHILGASGSGTTTLAAAIRLERLRARDVRRHGPEAIASGGALHQAHIEFLDWAGGYDTGGPEMRSRALHEAWLSNLTCATLRLDGDRSVTEQLARIDAFVENEEA